MSQPHFRAARRTIVSWETWTQIYAPLGSLGLSALVASLPIIFFFIALAVLRMKGPCGRHHHRGHRPGDCRAGVSNAVDMAFCRRRLWLLYGLWPIAWIIVCSVFLYKVTVKTGQFDIIRASRCCRLPKTNACKCCWWASRSAPSLEGAAGLAPRWPSPPRCWSAWASNPLYAAGLCLIANTARWRFGAMGIPILVAGKVTSIDPFLIGKMAGHQLPLLSVIVPFWLVFMMDGFPWHPSDLAGNFWWRACRLPSPSSLPPAILARNCRTSPRPWSA